jgi:hypothetical protein
MKMYNVKLIIYRVKETRHFFYVIIYLQQDKNIFLVTINQLKYDFCMINVNYIHVHIHIQVFSGKPSVLKYEITYPQWDIFTLIWNSADSQIKYETRPNKWAY